MARKVNLDVKGVIENMSWFTGDDGKRYEIFGTGGGARLAEELGVPLVGQVPLVSELRAGGDTGTPITVSEPGSEAATAFAAMAERLDTDLRPTKVRRSELKVL
jgi:ATP-binding protein involved in chromosome partitioning